METFRVLRAQPGRDVRALTDVYPTADALGARVVSQDSGSRTFHVWEDQAAFRNAVLSGVARFHNEVIFPDRPQKLRFDLDHLAPAHEAAARADLEDAVLDAVWAAYGDTAVARGLMPQFFWTQAHGPGVRSWHCIVYNFALPSAAEVDALARNVHTALARSPAGLAMDLGIYSAGSTRTLRALGCAKATDPSRIKRAANPQQASWSFERQWRAAAVTDTSGMLVLPARLTAAQAAPVRMPGTIPPEIGEVVARLPELAGHRFLRLTPSVLRRNAGLGDFVLGVTRAPAAIVAFQRIAPSQCPVCRREHTRDSLFALVVADAHGDRTQRYRVMLACHRSPQTAGSRPYVRLPDIEGPPVAGAENAADDDEDPAECYWRLLVASLPPHTGSRTPLSPVPGTEWLQYSEPRLRPFSTPCTPYTATTDDGDQYETTTPRTVFALAGLMIGKTQTLLDHVRETFPHDPHALVQPRIVMISCRRTFTQDLMRRFGELGFQSYTDFAAGQINASRVIVQVESLERYSLTAGAPDLLVIDEVSSVLLQLCSPHVRSPPQVIRCFEWLLQYSTQVVLMDAHMSEQVFTPILLARPGGALVHENLWSRENELGKRVEFTGDSADWLAEYSASLRAGRRVAVFTNSKAAAERYRTLFDKWAPPGSLVRLLTGDTPEAEKSRFFADVNASVEGLQCLIATPVITVGVSIDAEWFDEIFADFGGDSSPAEACMQMLGRVRVPRLRRIVVLAHMAVGGGALPCTIADVLDAAGRFGIAAVRAASAYDPIALGMATEITRQGLVRLVRFDSFCAAVWAGNSALVNASRRNFMRRMLELLFASGAEITPLATAPLGARNAARRALGVAREETQFETANQLLNAADFHDEAVAELRQRDDLDADEIATLRRADLRRRYMLGPLEFNDLLEHWPTGPVAAIQRLQRRSLQQQFSRCAMILQTPGPEAFATQRLVIENAHSILQARQSVMLHSARADLESLRLTVNGEDILTLDALATFMKLASFPTVLWNASVFAASIVSHLRFHRQRAISAATRLAEHVGVPRTYDFFASCLATICTASDEARLAALYDIMIIADKAYHQLFGARVAAGTAAVGAMYFRVQFPPEIALPSRAPQFAADEITEVVGQVVVPVTALLYPSTGRSDYPICLPPTEKIED